MKSAILLLFWVMWYLAFSTRSILAPFLPIIEDEFAINHTTVGGLYLFTAIGGTLALLTAGSISSRIGYKRLIAISFVLASSALLGLYFANTYLSLSLWLLLFGLSGGFYVPCAIPLLTACFSRKHWGKAISFHETAAGLNVLTVPFLVAVLFSYMPWRGVFIVFSAAFFSAAVVFWFVSPDTRRQDSRTIGIFMFLHRTDFWIVLALWTMSAIGAMGIYSIVPLFLVNERDMAIDVANRVLSLSRFGGFIGQIGIGFFLDRYDTRKIIFFLTLFSGMALVGLGMVHSNGLLILMLFLQATFCVVFFPVGIVAISKLTEPDERSFYTGGIMAISTILGLGLGPVFIGFIADTWNFQSSFLLLGVLTLGAGLLARLLRQF
jgi:NNP family nitrate/nitrite transporter-like MFS transporter